MNNSSPLTAAGLFRPSTPGGRGWSGAAVTAHVLLPLFLSTICMVGCLHRVYAFRVNDGDYGLFSNLLWNFAHGNGWHMSLYAGQVRANFLADHFALLVPLFAPFFRLFPSPYTLSVLHGIAFSAVFFLVPVLVRQIWKENQRDDYALPAVFIVLTLFFFRGFISAWDFQSHMTTLAMPFLLCALIALHRKSLVFACFFSLLLALAQERASVAVFGIGMYAMLITGNIKLGAALCFLSFSYFFTVVKILIPSFYTTGGYIYDSMIQPLHEVKKKILFLCSYPVRWYLLPFAGKRAFLAALCAIPVISIGLVSSGGAMYGFRGQYQDLPSMFLAASAAHALLWITARGWFSRVPKLAVLVLAVACLFVSARDVRYDLPLRSFKKARSQPWIGPMNRQFEAYKNIPAEIHVYATTPIGARLSMRERRYFLSPESAAAPFSKSMVFIAPHLSAYPHPSTGAIIRLLDDNPSLYVLEATEVLRVYASKDLSPADTGRP